MQTRTLGKGIIEVPPLIMGTATFGGGNEFFKKWGETGVAEATRLVDVALEHGCNAFDTADAYSDGLSEKILGEAIKGRRDKVLLATKTGFRLRAGDDDVGASYERIIRSCENSLRRLNTDYIDLYQLHGFDAMTPIEEMLRAMGKLVSEGKIRAFGVSNFSGWHLMKMLAMADQLGLPRPVSHQAYYSLLDREFEWELMPLGLDQDVSTLVWSPLASAQLTGRITRSNPVPPADSRASKDPRASADMEPLYRITDALEEVAGQVGRSIPQVALAWLLAQPTVSGVLIGARREDQLRDNLAAATLQLTHEQIECLSRASARKPIYPYWHQQAVYSERNPSPVPVYPV